MKLKTFLITAFALTTACASVSDYKAVRESDGLYRAQPKHNPEELMPENALRTSEGRLITDAGEADRALSSSKSVAKLFALSRADLCSSKTIYRAKVEQFKAERALIEGRYQDSLVALDVAERICPSLYLTSAQDYIRAVTLSRLGQDEKARAAAERFLAHAAALQPVGYVQSDASLGDLRKSWALEKDRLKAYRDRAQAYLRDGSKLEWDEQQDVAKFYPNNPFRPGGARVKVGLVAPAFVTTTETSVGGAVLGFYSWGLTSVHGLYGYSTDTGQWLSGRVRHSLYESPNRNLDVDAFVGLRTAKLIRTIKTRDLYGTHEDREVVRSSIDPSVGSGATYRLRPELGVSAQLGLIANRLVNKTDVPYSLFVSYDLIDGLSFNAGYIESKPMIAIGILYVQVGYDFRDQRLLALLQSFSF